MDELFFTALRLLLSFKSYYKFENVSMVFSVSKRISGQKDSLAIKHEE